MKKIALVVIAATLAFSSCTRNSGGEAPNREDTGTAGDGRPEPSQDSVYGADSARNNPSGADSVIPHG